MNEWILYVTLWCLISALGDQASCSYRTSSPLANFFAKEGHYPSLASGNHDASCHVVLLSEVDDKPSWIVRSILQQSWDLGIIIILIVYAEPVEPREG